VSTPKLFDTGHLSLEGSYLSPRNVRTDDAGDSVSHSPRWIGLDAVVYIPDLRGFDVTAGVRNIIGTRDQIPAPGDYDRFGDPNNPITVSKIPGEGREFFVKVGYSH